MTFTALIAEDEWLLAANLRAELAKLWPDLTVVASVGDGDAAVETALRLYPDVLFLDIRMPGMTGLEAAQALAEDWTSIDRPFPLIVFVTAYDQYAVQAFERAAFDYVLKPVEPSRLAISCERLKQRLLDRSTQRSGEPPKQAGGQQSKRANRQSDGEVHDASEDESHDEPHDEPHGESHRESHGGSHRESHGGSHRESHGGSHRESAKVDAAHFRNDALDGVVMQMRALLAAGIPGLSAAGASTSPLKIIQASVGNTIMMIPVEQVLYFEAADKYVRVVTAERDHLIRTSLRELLQRIDPNIFWQIHRGVVVRCDAIASAHRDESGKLTLTLHGHASHLAVSRLYADRFRGM